MTPDRVALIADAYDLVTFCPEVVLWYLPSA
jgi:hypothetical protein